jgi:hypothetical protein
MQQAGVDYQDVFSSVAQLKSFRLCVALSAAFGFKITHYDFDQAFVESTLPKPVYMVHPEGFPGPPNTCLKLIKSLYGLAEAPKLWSELLRSFLLTLGFIACVSDNCVLFHKQFAMWLVTFSDDVLVATSNESARKEVVNAIAKRFKIKQLGTLTKYVGIEVQYNNNGSISLSQPTYVSAILQRFGMTQCKSVSTPAMPNSQLLVPDSGADVPDVPYKSAVGSLWYASRGTRPDIEYATNTVAQFASSFDQSHWQAVKRVFRYLSSTISQSITYYKTGIISVVAYSDSDWGADLTSRKSKSGYVIFVAGGAVVWATKAQKAVALSSCEAEYYAMTETIKEMLWFIGLLSELSIKIEPPILRVDNQGAIALSQNPVNHQRTKHIDIRYHFIRDAIKAGVIVVKYVGTDENIADLFTKALATILFNRHCSTLVQENPRREPLEKCCLARTKRHIRTGTPHISHSLNRIASRRRARQDSMSPFDTYCPCLCGWYVRFRHAILDWAFACRNCHEFASRLHIYCDKCNTATNNNSMYCTNRGCSNSVIADPNNLQSPITSSPSSD